KAALFDLGKVLVDFDWFTAARRIAAKARVTPEALVEFIKTSDVMIRLEKGQMTNEQFFGEVRSVIGYQATLQDFQQAFSDIFTEIPEMVLLHARIQAAGIPTWIFSNTNDWAITHIRENFPFFATFDGYLLSYQLGVMKPDAGIYKAAEHTTGCRGGEILYIDDIAENAAAGAARGWQAIRHVSSDHTISQVERILFG
ncbi:MAG: HAD-IA family hydrolase, partial [Methylotetracoccus sp.]|nr:HAD-IA family hydrolase [Methylotetracoccus sp.]